MVRLDSYIVNISLPAVSRYFHVGLGDVSWVVLSYLLVMTSSKLVFGKLSDRLGLRKIFIGGYVLFSLGSLLCGLSPTIAWLNLSRGLQGFGGAMMVPAPLPSSPITCRRTEPAGPSASAPLPIPWGSWSVRLWEVS
jgi:MFS family permease